MATPPRNQFFRTPIVFSGVQFGETPIGLIFPKALVLLPPFSPNIHWQCFSIAFQAPLAAAGHLSTESRLGTTIPAFRKASSSSEAKLLKRPRKPREDTISGFQLRFNLRCPFPLHHESSSNRMFSLHLSIFFTIPFFKSSIDLKGNASTIMVSPHVP